MMSRESRIVAGVILVVLPIVLYGGYALLSMLIDPHSGYMDNPLRQNLFRAGHAHAGVFLVLSLVALRYVDDTPLSNGWKQYVRLSIPAAAILFPLAYFLSVVAPDAKQPNGLINLAYVGAIALAVGVIALGVGVLKGPRQP